MLTSPARLPRVPPYMSEIFSLFLGVEGHDGFVSKLRRQLDAGDKHFIFIKQLIIAFQHEFWAAALPYEMKNFNLKLFTDPPLQLDPEALLPLGTRPYHFCRNLNHLMEFSAVVSDLGVESTPGGASIWDFPIPRNHSPRNDDYKTACIRSAALDAMMSFKGKLTLPADALDRVLPLFHGAGKHSLVYRCIQRGDALSPGMTKIALGLRNVPLAVAFSLLGFGGTYVPAAFSYAILLYNQHSASTNTHSRRFRRRRELCGRYASPRSFAGSVLLEPTGPRRRLVINFHEDDTFEGRYEIDSLSIRDSRERHTISGTWRFHEAEATSERTLPLISLFFSEEVATLLSTAVKALNSEPERFLKFVPYMLGARPILSQIEVPIETNCVTALEAIGPVLHVDETCFSLDHSKYD